MTMTDHNLSPQAQAVLDAFVDANDGDWVEGEWIVNNRAMLSAALRAAAEELQYRLFLPGTDPMVVDARALFNLANELESGND
jgi:hypothetical protein